MSYTPTEWQRGDIVTSQKLNKLEQGVANAGGSGIFYVTKIFTGSDPVITSLNKTWKEIRDAAQSSLVTCKRTYADEDSCDFVYLSGYAEASNGDPYAVMFSSGETFFADTENDYPNDETTYN